MIFGETMVKFLLKRMKINTDISSTTENKETELNPHHGVLKGILARGGKGTLLKGRRNQSVVRIRKKEISEGFGQNYTEQRS